MAAWVQDSTGGAPGRLGYHSARSWRHAGVTPSRQNDAVGTAVRLCITRMIDGGTQYHRLSAAVKHPGDAELHWEREVARWRRPPVGQGVGRGAMAT